jgi:hypothetical protein
MLVSFGTNGIRRGKREIAKLIGSRLLRVRVLSTPGASLLDRR